VKREVEDRLKTLVKKGVCSLDELDSYVRKLKRVLERSFSEEECRKISEFYKALSDPTRVRILKMLNMRRMCVCELTAVLDLSQPTITHHLKIMERAKLIRPRKKGKLTYYEVIDSSIIKNMEEVLKRR